MARETRERIWSVYPWKPLEAHNGYIEIYLNLGMVGIALLAIVIVNGYRTVIAAWRQHSPIASLCLAFFLVGLVYNFTEAAYFRMMTPVWIFFLFAITRVPELSGSNVRTSEQEWIQQQYPAYLAANSGKVREEAV